MKSIEALLESPLEKPLTIHRIVGVERFLQMLYENKLTLMAPEKWDDPYEEAIQKHYEGEGSAFRGFKVFGLCWSTESRSDALWRIYSPNKLGIKISTTVEKLVNALALDKPSRPLRPRTFLGRVTYLPERTRVRRPYDWPGDALRLSASDFSEPVSTFANAIDQITRFTPTLATGDLPYIARAFLVKRRAFKHEEEVRLLCLPTKEQLEILQPKKLTNKVVASPTVIKLSTPMSEFITRVEFDPRMGNDVVEALTHYVSPKLQDLSAGGMIAKSTLYEIPRSKKLPQ